MNDVMNAVLALLIGMGSAMGIGAYVYCWRLRRRTAELMDDFSRLLDVALKTQGAVISCQEVEEKLIMEQRELKMQTDKNGDRIQALTDMVMNPEPE